MKTRAAILDAVNTPLKVEEVELIVPIGRCCLCAAARGEEHNLTNRLPRYIQDTIFVRQCRRELCGDLSKPTGCLPV